MLSPIPSQVSFYQKPWHSALLFGDKKMWEDSRVLSSGRSDEGLLRVHETEDRPIVTHKGGQVERDLLQKLNIPSIDLEVCGCPNTMC